MAQFCSAVGVMIMSDHQAQPAYHAVSMIDAAQSVRRSASFRPLFGPSPVHRAEEDHTPPTSWEDGYSAAKAEAAADHQAFVAMIASAQALQNEPSEELAALISETVFRLVSDIIGSTAINRDALISRATQAAAIIAECDGARTMWVNPQDMMLLQGHDFVLPLKEDPAAPRGSIRIECSSGWIEHGTSLYLDALRSALGLAEDGA
jgi:flagellar assembly protein FliH